MLPALFSFPDTTDLFKQLDEYAAELSRLDKVVQSGVMVEGPAAGYALVWEWGNARQTKKGPKTTLGINPDGKRVWLSIQAPRGYIRVLTPQFLNAIDKELEKIRFNEDSASIVKQLTIAADNVAKKIAVLISQNAPEDSGTLSSSIKAASMAELVQYDTMFYDEDEDADPTELSLENV